MIKFHYFCGFTFEIDDLSERSLVLPVNWFRLINRSRMANDNFTKTRKKTKKLSLVYILPL